MSSPQRPFPPLEVRGVPACMCGTGGACSTFAPGHATHLIQARLAAATPSGWTDAIVTAVAADGTLVLHAVHSGETHTVWNVTAGDVEIGSPVALHERYHLLAAGARRLNVSID